MANIDVTGFKLGEALEILMKTGAGDTSVIITAPPGSMHKGYDENCRVLRQTMDAENKKVELVVNASESL